MPKDPATAKKFRMRKFEMQHSRYFVSNSEHKRFLHTTYSGTLMHRRHARCDACGPVDIMFFTFCRFVGDDNKRFGPGRNGARVAYSSRSVV